MKVTKRQNLIDITFINESTGECSKMKATQKITEKNYNIKRFNMKIWFEAYNFVMESVCNSKKDIEIFNTIINELDLYNQFSSPHKEVTDLLNINKQRFSAFLKRLRDIGFIAKSGKVGVYKINPFVLVSKKIKKNEEIERLQYEWKKRYCEPTLQMMKENGSLI